MLSGLYGRRTFLCLGLIVPFAGCDSVMNSKPPVVIDTESEVKAPAAATNTKVKLMGPSR